MLYNRENPLKVVTLCSGYDSQCLALNRLKEKYPDFEYELTGWSEIDKYAIQAHDALFPQWKDRNLGDMSKIDWNSFDGDIDLLTYSTPCFVAGTLILTRNGYKPIEDISEGDYVLTHNDRYRLVCKAMNRLYYGKLYKVVGMSCNEIECTDEHPFYVRELTRVWNNDKRQYERVFTKPTWVVAKDLTKSHYLSFAINQESSMPKWNGVEDNRWGHHRNVNELSEKFNALEFWYLMGRYVGDGWQRNDETHKGITICCGGRNEDRLTSAIASLGYNATITQDKTVRKYFISNKELCEFVSRYGRYAYGKHIDGETMNLPVTSLFHFLLGCIDSDGYSHDNLTKISTASKELAYGLSQCIAKVFHRPVRIYRTDRPESAVIDGRIVKQRDSWDVIWKSEDGKQDQAFYEDGYVWFPIRSITTEDVGGIDVYNMEVNEDNSYVANGAIVHNCQDFSPAGRQAGGDEDSGTRSSLLWFTRNAVIAKKPKFLMMENVKAVVSDKFAYLFHKWEQELATYGYTNYCRVLNSKDYGVPQNRERIFLISVLNEEHTFHFPEPFPLERRLKDVLEEKVDEKYYLDDAKVQSFVEHCDKKQAEGCGFKFEPSTPPTTE